jgi:hypothetical protein
MLLSKDASQAQKDWNKNAAEVAKVSDKNKMPFYIVTATTEAAQKQLPQSESIHYLKCDATVIKTAGRVNPTYFVMKGATIVGKYANADFDEVIKLLNSYQANFRS